MTPEEIERCLKLLMLQEDMQSKINNKTMELFTLIMKIMGVLGVLWFVTMVLSIGVIIGAFNG